MFVKVDFGTRKIQQLSIGTMNISLPVAWVRSTGVKKHDELHVELMEDGSLRITPVKAKEKTI